MMVFIARFLIWLAKRATVTQHNEYAERYWLHLRPSGAGIVIHHVAEPVDLGLDPHNHPWWFFTFIFRGGYTERLVMPDGSVRTRHLRAWSVAFRRPSQYHQVDVDPGGYWSLFFCGPRKTKWGFLVGGKHVGEKKYLKRKGISRR